MLIGKQRPGAAHTTHHLIKNHQDAVFIADFANTLEVPLYRRYHPSRGATDGLGDESRYVFWTQSSDFRFQFIGNTLAIFFL